MGNIIRKSQREYIEGSESEGLQQMPKWLMSVACCVFLAVLIVFLYINILRYFAVFKSVENRDTTSTALLLSPEIATSISSIVRYLQ